MKRILSKSRTIKEVETKIGGEIEDELRRLYVDEHLPAHDIANKLNVTYLTVLKWLAKSGVRSRKIRVEK